MGNGWDKIFNVNDGNFIDLALEVFRFQYRHNPVYRTYVDMLKFNSSKINRLCDIPFLPIRFFKTHAIKTTEFDSVYEFESSGTTQTANSHHYVKDIGIYRESFLKAFELFYGRAQDWCILGLLPSYLERKSSSLVFMVDELIRQTGHEKSGFYLYDYKKLHETLQELEERKQKTLLIGVTFALLDFAAEYPLSLKCTTIMETGGMKGRRDEMVRGELHQLLQSKFNVDTIHSEYGMTELLSQAYSKGNGIFYCPPWMKVLMRDEEDPFAVRSSEFGVQSSESGAQGSEIRVQSQQVGPHSPTTTTGVLNIIDLANIYSCSFIATDDGGKLFSDGSFEVIGRIDNSDIRGCSLMAI